MKAIQLVAHGTPGKFELREVAEPPLGPGEARVEVRACGLNHLDLWLEEGSLPIPINLPRIPGCEIAGLVTELAPDVQGWQVGDRVAVQSNLFCGTCEYCRQSEESMCLNNVMLGVQRDGGFAEQVVVPERALAPLPQKVSFETSAALTLAGSTAMHMLTDRTHVRSGDWVLVMGGASGVGSAAIQIAKDLGGRVISTGSTPAKREAASKLGAEFVLDTADSKWTTEVRKITSKRGVDLVVEHVGGAVFEQIFLCLARGGTVVTCGATAGSKVHMDLWPFFVKQQRLMGSYGRNKNDLHATLEWAAARRLKPVIDTLYPLEKAAEAFARLNARDVLGKLVVQPSPSP
ncbi:MAG TPA: alcohol dehydrogenase catalytic domain-containing protein [Candidatus Saccharimonadales bacterium]|nr:alcohol dehydrogenase catalytic domain-containing protein [Candidatus Saccharimonadales bacterium]